MPPLSTHSPLSDITVIDLTQILAGPYATMTLGDLGADVIKIESKESGDIARTIQPYPEYFDSVNRNKKSIALDLKTDNGRSIALDLLADADVFIQAMKPSSIDSFGLSYDVVKEVNPELIYCTLDGWGSDSPYSHLPSMDLLVQGISGMMGLTGTEDGTPVWSGLPVGDLIPAMYVLQSVLTALYARAEGRIDGEYIEVPMLDCMVSSLSIRAGHTFGTDQPFPMTGTRHPTLAPYGIYHTETSQIVLAAATETTWENLCEALDRPDLRADCRFETLDDRVANRDALIEALEAEFAEVPATDLVDTLHEYNISAGKINDTKSIWTDPHVERRELRQTMDRDGEDVEVIDNPVRFRNLETTLETPPPRLGEQSSEILRELGYSEAEIESLHDDGIFQ